MKYDKRGKDLGRRHAYGPTMTVVFDEAPTTTDANSRKLDRILDILERERGGGRDRLSPTESLKAEIQALMEQYQKDARRHGVNMGPDMSPVDYGTRNPHRRRPAIECSERPHIRKDGRFEYENAEDRVTVPGDWFEKDYIDPETMYAARNPHKNRGQKGKRAPLPAKDSRRRTMNIYEEAEAAYAARNPHKR